MTPPCFSYCSYSCVLITRAARSFFLHSKHTESAQSRRWPVLGPPSTGGPAGCPLPSESRGQRNRRLRRWAGWWGVRFLHFLSSGSITGQSESRAEGCDSLETPGGLWHPRASAPQPLRPRESRSGIAPVSPWTFPVGRGVCACAPCWVRSAVLQKHTGRSGGTASWHLGAPPRALLPVCALSGVPLSSVHRSEWSGPWALLQLAEAGGRSALSCCGTRPVHLLALGCSGLLVGRLFGSLFVQSGSAAPPGCWVLCRDLVWPLPSCTHCLMGQRRWRVAWRAVAEGS